MPTNLDDLKRTGIYTVYDRMSLAETTAVVDMKDVEGVRSIFQWHITGSDPKAIDQNNKMLEARVYDVRTGKWSEWKYASNAPIPPQPVPVVPGVNPNDGLWNVVEFRDIKMVGNLTYKIAFNRNTNLPITKPCYLTYDASVYWVQGIQPPVKFALLFYDNRSNAYVWRTQRDPAEPSPVRIDYEDFKPYQMNDWKMENITKPGVAPPRPVVSRQWRMATVIIHVAQPEGGNIILGVGDIYAVDASNNEFRRPQSSRIITEAGIAALSRDDVSDLLGDQNVV